MTLGELLLSAQRHLRAGARTACAALLLAVHVASGAADLSTLRWKDLLPPDWDSWHYYQNFYRLFPKVNDIDDKDPRAVAILAEMRRISSKVPSRDDLDGRRVRLPGYMSPLRQGSAREIEEFLLVPYQGACIHRPLPPANQIVHVGPRGAVAAELEVRAVWVTGVIEVRRTETALGSASYRIRDARVELVDLEREGAGCAASNSAPHEAPPQRPTQSSTACHCSTSFSTRLGATSHRLAPWAATWT